MAIADIVRKLESTTNSLAEKRALKKGWVPQVTGYSGYGAHDSARVLGRVLLADPDRDEEESWAQRGYRQFFTIQVGDIPVSVTLGDATVHSSADAQGYVDVYVPDHGLAPGWHKASITVEGRKPVSAEVHIFPPDTKVGIISDIDDTILVTGIPRAWTAAWNSWVRRTDTRKPVPGMASFYKGLLEQFPDAPVVYLSTGAWNTYETLQEFITHNDYPSGPMLLTDWGPTPTGLFRSGKEHKRVELRNLFLTYPDIEWILIGDDGQHDPRIYVDAAAEHPEHVHSIAIRNLSPEEQLLAHGTLAPLEQAHPNGRADIPLIQGADGLALRSRISELIKHD